MTSLNEITEKIKVLKSARDALKDKYERTDFHKKKETHPHSAVPPSPDDEEILKLLTAIQQIEILIKELQDFQLDLLKQQEIA